MPLGIWIALTSVLCQWIRCITTRPWAPASIYTFWTQAYAIRTLILAGEQTRSMTVLATDRTVMTVMAMGHMSLAWRVVLRMALQRIPGFMRSAFLIAADRARFR